MARRDCFIERQVEYILDGEELEEVAHLREMRARTQSLETFLRV